MSSSYQKITKLGKLY